MNIKLLSIGFFLYLFFFTLNAFATAYHPLVYNVIILSQACLDDIARPFVSDDEEAQKGSLVNFIDFMKEKIEQAKHRKQPDVNQGQPDIDRDGVMNSAGYNAQLVKSCARPLTAIKFAHKTNQEPLITEDLTSLEDALRLRSEAHKLLLAYSGLVQNFAQDFKDISKLELALAKIQQVQVKLQEIIDRKDHTEAAPAVPKKN